MTCPLESVYVTLFVDSFNMDSIVALTRAYI